MATNRVTIIGVQKNVLENIMCKLCQRYLNNPETPTNYVAIMTLNTNYIYRVYKPTYNSFLIKYSQDICH